MGMSLRHFAVTAGVVCAGTAALLVACGFPSPYLADADGGKRGGFDASEDVEVTAPFDPDAQIVDDAGEKVDTTNCASTTCDCDHDGFNDFTKPGCAASSANDAGDCDDSDSRYRPDQDFVRQKPTTNGDWNCDGQVETYYKNVNVGCGGLLNAAACVATEGFKTAPGCGESGQYVHCVVGGALNLGCVDGPIEERIQSCR